MKTIIFIILYAFTVLALTNYIPENKGNTTYTDQGVCQLKSGQTCYPFDSSRDLEIMLVKDVQIDNPEKPIYAARTDETDCVLEQNIEAFKNNKNFELMQIHFKKAIEYVKNNKDSYRISGEIIHAHLNYVSELKNL
jgi:hypothetical protein